MVWDVLMESAGHQIIVLVKLDGKDPIATFVFLYQAVIMALATMPLNAIVKLAGKEHSVTFLAVKTAQMDSALHPMNVSVPMDGLEKIVMYAHLVLDANMELAKIILTPVSAKIVGKDSSVINHHAVWIATMDYATHLVKLIQPTFAFVNLDGKEQAVTYVDLTGDVPTKGRMHVTIPMNVSASTMRLILKASATTQS